MKTLYNILNNLQDINNPILFLKEGAGEGKKEDEENKKNINHS